MPGLLDNPYIAMGLGILGSSGPGTNAAQSIGKGGLLGLEFYQRAQEMEERRRLKEMEAKQRQLEFEAQQGLLSNIPEEMRPWVAAGQAGKVFDQLYPQQGEFNPKIQTVNEGNDTVTYMIDPESRQMVEIARGPRWNPNSGMSLEVGPDRTVRFGTGGNWPKATQNEMSKKQFNDMEMLGRLNTIKASFDPKGLEYRTRIHNSWLAGKEKLGANLSAEEKAQLRQYTTDKRKTLENLNLLVKDMSGGAVTVQEAERIMPTMPNFGTGIFDGDSPTEFEAKVDDVLATLQAAMDRRAYAMENGMDWRNLPLDAFKNKSSKADDATIQARGDQLEQQFMEQYPNETARDIKARVKGALKLEFGK